MRPTSAAVAVTTVARLTGRTGGNVENGGEAAPTSTRPTYTGRPAITPAGAAAPSAGARIAGNAGLLTGGTVHSASLATCFAKTASNRAVSSVLSNQGT